jgi:predicted nucleic acid-binding protein
MRLYLDANAIIYGIEGASSFRTQVLDRIARAAASGSGVLFTSRLSRLECRVKPLRDGRMDLVSSYDTFLSPGSVDLIEIDPDIIELATEVRVKYRFKAPDAIHPATAIRHRADLFLSGDKDLQRCREVQVDVISN